MLLYNETIGIDKEIEHEWLLWMRENYIPAVMKTEMFVDWKIYKILHDNEDGTISYSVQYFAPSINHVEKYLELFAPVLADAHRQKFANRHVAFRTLLQEVQ